MDKLSATKLMIYKKNFNGLLAVKTRPQSPERFKKRMRLKSLKNKINKLEELING